MFFWRDFSTYGERTALVEKEKHITYSELAARCEDFAKKLNPNKSLILLGVDNSIESVVAFYGALIANHAVMLADHDSDELRKNLTTNFKPNYSYFKSDSQWQLIEHETGVEHHNLHPDLALMLSTSGSTGSGKCVRLTQKNIEANADSICQYLNIRADDRACLILPFHYSYGLSVLNTHLRTGATVHLGDISVASAEFIPYMQQHKISSLAGVPYTFDIIERAGFRQHQLPDLRYVTQAGGRLAPEKVSLYAAWAKEQRKQFFVMYGQTEATARISYMPPEQLENFPQSIGVSIPGGELSLRDENGKTIEQHDVPGELIYRGDNVMMGYAESADDLALGCELEYLSTGDIAYKNTDGYFCIVGRLKRFAKIYGKRFNLDEVEKYLTSAGLNVMCVSDDETLFVCFEKNVDASALNLITNKYGIAEQNIFLHAFDEFPLLASGKIDYRSMLQAAANEQESREENDKKDLDSDRESAVIHIFEKHLKNHNIASTDTFTALGGDSLTYVGVSVDLEKVVGSLPNQWPKMSVAEIANLKQKKSSTPKIDVAIPLRVAAILAVVTNHAGFHAVAGGAVLLLLLAGFNYCRFQLDQQLIGNPLNVFKQIIIHVLIPYWAFIVVFGLLKGSPIEIYNLLLIGNLVGDVALHNPFGVWFIEALVQCMLIFSLPMLIPKIKHWIAANKWSYTFLLLILGCLARTLDGYFSWGFSLNINGEQLSWVFWIFALGAAIAAAPSGSQRILLSILALALPLGFYWGDPSRITAGIAGALIILWSDRVPLPRFLIPGVQLVGSASMFIYMLHPRAPIDSLTADWQIDCTKDFNWCDWWNCWVHSI